MNAVNPVHPATLSNGQSSAEPSMEEILASIRRIIADDQSMPRAHPDLVSDPEPPAAPATTKAQPVVEAGLPDIIAPARPGFEVHSPNVSAHEARAASSDEPPPHDGIAAPRDAVAAAVTSPEPAPAGSRIGPRDGERETGSAAAPDVVPDQEKEPAMSSDRHDAPAVPDRLFSATIDSSVTAAFNTLAASRLVDHSEDLMALAREMIRPMLKAWVEEHLPAMVERMVVAEIERIARGGR